MCFSKNSEDEKMDLVKRHKFYKELFQAEIDFKNNFSSRLQIPLALLLTLSAGLTNLITTNNPFTEWLAPYLYNIFLFSGMFLVARAALYFKRAAWGQAYPVFNTSKTLESYYEGLSNTKSDEVAEKEFSEYLNKELLKCQSETAEVNSLRADNLHTCMFSLYASILVVSVTFFTASFIPKSDKVTTISNPDMLEQAELIQKTLRQLDSNVATLNQRALDGATGEINQIKAKIEQLERAIFKNSKQSNVKNTKQVKLRSPKSERE
jgi:hypothetical protein